jgi:uncharacterized protein (DUF433 family)
MGAREAARQLQIPASTLWHWLEGGNRGGTWYEPVLRTEPTGQKDVTWGEMVEARYLRAYRREHSVSMQRLRPFIARLREELGVPYPLAHFKPYVDTGRRLLLAAQQEAGLPEELRAVWEVTTGQLVLTAAVEEFLARVDFAEAGEREAQRIYPAGRQSPVVIDPLVASGAASVRGVRTEAIAELVEAEVPVKEVAADFGLPLSLVKAAVSYEWSSTTDPSAA